MLLSLPLELNHLMFLEGGAEASLYVKSGNIEMEWTGSYESLFLENYQIASGLCIPNIIGIKKK
jgi:hypothetical protein